MGPYRETFLAVVRDAMLLALKMKEGATSQGCRQPIENRKGKEMNIQEGSSPVDNLILDH